ncbi:MAG: hypothetical protein K5888_11560 [Lachnospiraceae bacterium]|nr:hypothetical protein [Lachnospiraceae bacterium]
MRNEYLKVIMSDRNEFRTTADLSFKGTDYTKLDVKIDTGCGYSSLPVSRLGLTSSEAYLLKVADSADPSVKKSISFGVNDSKLKREEDKRKFKRKMYMDLSGVTFKHNLSGLSIGSYPIGDCDIRISYDRTGNILIGMDILKLLDVHMGTIGTGQTILLACRKGKLSQAYREELNKLFDVRKIS